MIALELELYAILMLRPFVDKSIAESDEGGSKVTFIYLSISYSFVP